MITISRKDAATGISQSQATFTDHKGHTYNIIAAMDNTYDEFVVMGYSSEAEGFVIAQGEVGALSRMVYFTCIGRGHTKAMQMATETLITRYGIWL